MSSGPNIPRSTRKRRQIELTLSDEARARLATLARERGETRSGVIEELILATLAPFPGG